MKLSKSFSTIAQVLCLVFLSAFALPAAVTNVELARTHTAAQVALNGGANGCTVSGASVTTGTTPSVITCVAAHNFATGDQVQITGIVGTTTDNVTAWVTVLSATTFSIYNNVNMQPTQGIIGTGTYSSGGYVTEALDVSGISAPWTIRLRIEGLSANSAAVIYIQDSATGFVSDVQNLAVYQVSGGVANASQEIEKTWRDYELGPTARIGVQNGRLRVLIYSLTSGASITTTLLVQN
jgi:hypothetical protein